MKKTKGKKEVPVKRDLADHDAIIKKAKEDLAKKAKELKRKFSK